MSRPKLSMRLRFTVLVTFVAALLAVSTVMFGTARVKNSIISDLLDANADTQADDALSILSDPVIVEDFGADFGLDFEASDLMATIADLDSAGLYDPLARAAGVEPDDGILVLGTIGNLIRVSPTRGSLVDLDPSEAGPLITAFSLYDLSFLTIDAEQLILADRLGGFPEGALESGQLTPDLPRSVDVSLTTAVRDRSGLSVLSWADTSDVQRSVDRFRSALWLVTPLVLFGAAAATWFLAGRALRPVVDIADRASKISGGNLDERVPEPGTGDEIDHLARTVNAMLARLEHDDARRRRFISDASHELRSPVAVLRSQAEVAMREPSDVDVSAYASDVAAESERLGRIVDDMLVLVRGDEARFSGSGRKPVGSRVAAGAEIDLDDVVLDEARRGRATPIDTNGVSAVKVPGREETWARIVRHLLDNASRHAESQVWVGIRTDAAAGGLVSAILWVDDNGSGIAPADRSAVFERFTRLDEARSRDRGGAGLGLAVVAESVADLGGSVEVEESPAGGARFVVRVPTVSPG